MNHNLKMKLRALSKDNALFSRLYHAAARIKTERLREMSDEDFLKRKFKENTGKELNLDNPQTFNEKLQWLKLHDRNPLYTQLVDKYRVRKYVAEKIGAEYLNNLYGVYDNFDKIDLNKLPNQFVLKCNHDCGSIVICKDKSRFDFEKAKNQFENALRHNYYLESREWPYKNVVPKIIAEEYLEDSFLSANTDIFADADGLIDYKFYCFSGVPKFLYVGFANIKNGVKRDLLSFFDLKWNPTPFYRKDHEKFPIALDKPELFEKMIEIASILSKGIPFVRVDLFSINKRILFSELTFFPGGGYGEFYPKEYNNILGSWIELPKIDG